MLTRIEHWLTPNENLRRYAEPVLRVSISLIFIIGGLGHFGEHDLTLARIHDSPWHSWILKAGEPSLLLWLSGVVFIVAGTALALGWKTRIAALSLFATLIPITVTIHIAPGHVGPLFKNVAILGALFFIFCRGAGRIALDREASPAPTLA